MFRKLLGVGVIAVVGMLASRATAGEWVYVEGRPHREVVEVRRDVGFCRIHNCSLSRCERWHEVRREPCRDRFDRCDRRGVDRDYYDVPAYRVTPSYRSYYGGGCSRSSYGGGVSIGSGRSGVSIRW